MTYYQCTIYPGAQFTLTLMTIICFSLTFHSNWSPINLQAKILKFVTELK